MILLEKKLAETPLQAIQRLRLEKEEYTSTKLAYAGRLDPMATGKLLILEGEECKQRDKYQKLDKEYEFFVIVGFETDSLDLLGLITRSGSERSLDLTQFEELEKHILKLKNLPYPVFSAVRVLGKPLYWWYLNGKIDTIDIPYKEITVYNFAFIEKRTINRDFLKAYITNTFSKIEGNFRKDEIGNSYDKLFKDQKAENFELYKFKAKVSSGTYIRSIAREIGTFFDLPVTTFSINRTEIFLPVS